MKKNLHYLGYCLPNRKATFAFLSVLLFCFHLVPAQNFPWVMHPKSNQRDEPHAMAVDGQGNMYVGGGFTGIVAFPKDTLQEVSTNRTDIFLSKINTEGKQVWLKQVGGRNFEEIFEMSLNNRNELLVSGHFAHRLNFDSTRFAPLKSNLGCVQSMGFIAKYDTTGTVKWAVHIDTPNGWVKNGKIVGSKNGGMFVLGNFQGQAVFSNTISLTAPDGSFIAYYNTAGVCQWAELVNNFETWSNNIITDTNGNALLSCRLNTNRSFLNTTVAGSDKYMLAKVDTLGNLLWTKALPFSVSEIVLSSSGDMYVASSFKGDTNIDGVNLNTHNTTANYPVLAMFNAAGVCQWAKVINSGIGFSTSSLRISGKDNLYLFGYLNGTFQHQQVQLTATPKSANGSCLAALKFDAAGNCIWAQRAGYSEPTSIYNMGVDNLENIYFAGVVQNGSAQLGKYTVSPTYPGTGLSWPDMYFAKLSPPLSATLPQQTVCTNSQVSIPVTATDSAGSGSIFYDAGNIFTAEISDASGNFTNPLVLGAIPSFKNNAITATIPGNLASGSGYKVRIMSSSPPLTIELDDQLKVSQMPVVTVGNFAPVDASTQAFNLSGGLPAGGNYSGPGVSNNIFDPAIAGIGNHTITYSYSQNGCSASVTAILKVSTISGLNADLTADQVSLYPNPCSNELHINLGQNFKNAEKLEIRLMDILGREVISKSFQVETNGNEMILNLADLPEGTYTLKLQNENQQVVRKVIRL